MTLRERLLLRFKKNQVIKCRIYRNDHRISERYIVPHDNQIKMPTGHYVIKQDRYTIENGIPTYTFVENRPDPIDIIDEIEGVKANTMTAQEVKALVESDIIKKVMDSADGKSDVNMTTVMLGIIIVVLIVLAGYLYTQVDAITEMINEIHDVYYTGGD